MSQAAAAGVSTRRAIRGGLPARVVVAACAAALAFGAVGTASAGAGSTEPTVSVGKVKGLGKVLVDAEGHTLYSLVKHHQAVPCTGDCLNTFMPLTIAAGMQPTAGKGVKGIGVAPGISQVTVNNFPMFVFPGDAPHQAKGEGMASSGGTWHAPKVTAGSSKHKKGGGESNPGSGGVSF